MGNIEQQTSYNNPALDKYKSDEPQKTKGKNQEQVAALGEEDREEYYQSVFSGYAGDELKTEYAKAVEANETMVERLKEAKKQVRKKLKNSDKEKATQGQKLLAEIEALIRSLEDGKADIGDAQTYTQNHNRTVTDHVKLDNLTFDGSTHVLKVDAPENYFEDEETKKVQNEKGEIIFDANGDGKLTLDDKWYQEFKNSLQHKKIIFTEGDIKIHKIDPLTDTIEIIVLKDEGWTKVVIEGFSNADLVFDKISEESLDAIKDSVPPEVTKQWYVGDNSQNLFQRLHVPNIDQKTRLEAIPEYQELKKASTITELLNNWMDATANFSNEQYKQEYDKLIDKIFTYYDTKNPEQDLEQFIGSIFQDITKHPAEVQANLVKLLAMAFLKHPKGVGKLFLEAFTPGAETILQKTGSVNDKAMIILLKRDDPSVWGTYFSINGENPGKFKAVDDQNLKVLDKVKLMVLQLGLPEPAQLDQARKYEQKLLDQINEFKTKLLKNYNGQPFMITEDGYILGPNGVDLQIQIDTQTAEDLIGKEQIGKKIAPGAAHYDKLVEYIIAQKIAQYLDDGVDPVLISDLEVKPSQSTKSGSEEDYWGPDDKIAGHTTAWAKAGWEAGGEVAGPIGAVIGGGVAAIGGFLDDTIGSGGLAGAIYDLF